MAHIKLDSPKGSLRETDDLFKLIDGVNVGGPTGEKKGLFASFWKKPMIGKRGAKKEFEHHPLEGPSYSLESENTESETNIGGPEDEEDWNVESRDDEAIDFDTIATRQCTKGKEQGFPPLPPGNATKLINPMKNDLNDSRHQRKVNPTVSLSRTKKRDHNRTPKDFSLSQKISQSFDSEPGFSVPETSRDEALDESEDILSLEGTGLDDLIGLSVDPVAEYAQLTPSGEMTKVGGKFGEHDSLLSSSSTETSKEENDEHPPNSDCETHLQQKEGFERNESKIDSSIPSFKDRLKFYKVKSCQPVVAPWQNRMVEQENDDTMPPAGVLHQTSNYPMDMSSSETRSLGPRNKDRLLECPLGVSLEKAQHSVQSTQHFDVECTKMDAESSSVSDRIKKLRSSFEGKNSDNEFSHIAAIEVKRAEFATKSSATADGNCLSGIYLSSSTDRRISLRTSMDSTIVASDDDTIVASEKEASFGCADPARKFGSSRSSSISLATENTTTRCSLERSMEKMGMLDAICTHEGRMPTLAERKSAFLSSGFVDSKDSKTNKPPAESKTNALHQKQSISIFESKRFIDETCPAFKKRSVGAPSLASMNAGTSSSLVSHRSEKMGGKASEYQMKLMKASIKEDQPLTVRIPSLSSKKPTFPGKRCLQSSEQSFSHSSETAKSEPAHTSSMSESQSLKPSCATGLGWTEKPPSDSTEASSVVRRKEDNISSRMSAARNIFESNIAAEATSKYSRLSSPEGDISSFVPNHATKVSKRPAGVCIGPARKPRNAKKKNLGMARSVVDLNLPTDHRSCSGGGDSRASDSERVSPAVKVVIEEHTAAYRAEVSLPNDVKSNPFIHHQVKRTSSTNLKDTQKAKFGSFRIEQNLQKLLPKLNVAPKSSERVLQTKERNKLRSRNETLAEYRDVRERPEGASATHVSLADRKRSLQSSFLAESKHTKMSSEEESTIVTAVHESYEQELAISINCIGAITLDSHKSPDGKIGQSCAKRGCISQITLRQDEPTSCSSSVITLSLADRKRALRSNFTSESYSAPRTELETSSLETTEKVDASNAISSAGSIQNKLTAKEPILQSSNEQSPPEATQEPKPEQGKFSKLMDVLKPHNSGEAFSASRGEKIRSDDPSLASTKMDDASQGGFSNGTHPLYVTIDGGSTSRECLSPSTRMFDRKVVCHPSEPGSNGQSYFETLGNGNTNSERVLIKDMTEQYFCDGSPPRQVKKTLVDQRRGLHPPAMSEEPNSADTYHAVKSRFTRKPLPWREQNAAARYLERNKNDFTAEDDDQAMERLEDVELEALCPPPITLPARKSGLFCPISSTPSSDAWKAQSDAIITGEENTPSQANTPTVRGRSFVAGSPFGTPAGGYDYGNGKGYTGGRNSTSTPQRNGSSADTPSSCPMKRDFPRGNTPVDNRRIF